MKNKALDNLDKLNDLAQDLSLEVYLVGGAIRDFILDRKLKDFDFIVAGASKDFALKFADLTEGSFVTLDQKRGMYRVVIKEVDYDFTAYNGELKAELERRDFTINALALELANYKQLFKVGEKEVIIDYFNGINDLNSGIIKDITPQACKDDPVRILRAARFKANFKFFIESKTLSNMKKYFKLLEEVAEERIKDELIKFFAADHLAEEIEFFESELALFSFFIPEVKQMKKLGKSKHHQYNVWQHSLRAISVLEDVLAEHKWANKIAGWKLPALKLALLFHDLGKVFTIKKEDGAVHFYGHEQKGAKYIDEFLRELCFSNQMRRYIVKLIRNHMRPLYLFNSRADLTRRGRYRFYREIESEIYDLLIFSLADIISTRKNTRNEAEIQKYQSFLDSLVADYQEFNQQEDKIAVDGNDLIRELDLTEGPEIGELLAKIKEAQALGEIIGYHAAIEYAKQLLKK